VRLGIIFAISLLLVVFISRPGYGVTYYIDPSNGNDSNNGTSQGTAWKTISKVNLSSLNPGDNVLFKRGEILRETLIVPSSGSSGKPITFGAYGSGNMPVISGFDLITGWSTSGNSYVKYDLGMEIEGIDKTVTVLLDDSIRLQYNPDKDNLSPGEYFHNSTDDDLYLRLPGDDDPSGHTIEAQIRHSSLESTYQDFITVEDIYFEGGVYGTYQWRGNDQWTIQDCRFRYIGSHAIKLEGEGGAGNTNNLIRRNDIRYIGGSGIDEYIKPFSIRIDGGSNNNTFEYNQSVDSEYGAVFQTDSDSNIFRYNWFECNGEKNFTLINSDSNEVYYNLFIHHGGNWDYILQLSNGSLNNRIYNNTLRATLDADADIGIWITGNSTGTHVKNNIIYSSARCLIVDSGSEVNAVLDHNCYYRSSPGALITWAGTDYTSEQFSSYQRASGQDVNSFPDDPEFIDTDKDDLNLSIGSPCINEGVYVGLTQNFEGNYIPQGSAPDIGAY